MTTLEALYARCRASGEDMHELARRGGRKTGAKRRKAAANLKAAQSAYWNKD